MRPHRVLGHQPRDTRLCHEARAKVLGHQRPARHPEPRDSKSLFFPSAWGNTQPLCSLADKGSSQGCCGQGKQGEIQILGLLLSQCSHSPTHSLHWGATGPGWHGPSSALHPRNTQPCWKERGGKFTQTAVVWAQRPKGMEKSGCQLTSTEKSLGFPA